MTLMNIAHYFWDNCHRSSQSFLSLAEESLSIQKFFMQKPYYIFDYLITVPCNSSISTILILCDTNFQLEDQICIRCASVACFLCVLCSFPNHSSVTFASNRCFHITMYYKPKIFLLVGDSSQPIIIYIIIGPIYLHRISCVILLLGHLVAQSAFAIFQLTHIY